MEELDGILLQVAYWVHAGQHGEVSGFPVIEAIAMKLAFQILIFSFFGFKTCVAPETISASKATPSPTGFKWLRQFEGEWVIRAASSGAESGSAGTSEMISRTVGSSWIVSEQHGQGDSVPARRKLDAAMEVAESNPEKYASVIKKIKLDLRRLE